MFTIRNQSDSKATNRKKMRSTTVTLIALALIATTFASDEEALEGGQSQGTVVNEIQSFEEFCSFFQFLFSSIARNY